MECILLHGLGQNPSDWDETVKHIGGGLSISRPALFDWLGDDASYARLYRGLEKYCEKLDEPFTLVGLSLGGVLALQYAAEHGDRVRSLILIGTQFSMPANTLRLQNAIFRFLPNAAFGKTGLTKKQTIALCKSMMSLDLTEALKDIRCRTLILCGDKDRPNLAASVKLAERIENAALTVISASGHEVNRDNPITLAQTIGAFCGQA